MLMHGLMIITNLKELSESNSRLFRKKRKQLMKKTNLKHVKNGVYLIPFENTEPSEGEIQVYEQNESLIRHFNVKASYFVATQVEIEHVIEGDTFPFQSYLVIKPIKILRK